MVRVVHYVNQYFAGIGGEEHADVGPDIREGAVGPAVGLQNALGDEGTVVATVFCGDGYMASHGDAAAAEVVELIRRYNADVVVAGPSFGSGRYGLACGLVCVAVQEHLGIPALAGMHRESPGAELHRRSVTIVPTRETAAGMGVALPGLARLALKLARHEPLGTPAADGYLPRGFRRNEFSDDQAAVRAVTMLVQKLKGDAFETEWPLPLYDAVPAPPAVDGDAKLKVALVSEAGVVPRGNPDAFPSGWATTWAKYDISNLDDLTAEDFETVHGGFDTVPGNEDPDRLVPLDVLRDLETLGTIELDKNLYSTVGNMGSISEMRRLGAEMAGELQAAGVDVVVLGAT